MKKNQETAHTILLEILNGTRPLTEDGIRALVQEDPEIAVLLILEQARRLRDILGSKQRKAASTPSGMIPPHEKPIPRRTKRRSSGAVSQVTKGLAAKIRMRLRKQWSILPWKSVPIARARSHLAKVHRPREPASSRIFPHPSSPS